jgi:hypothetical protein
MHSYLICSVVFLSAALLPACGGQKAAGGEDDSGGTASGGSGGSPSSGGTASQGGSGTGGSGAGGGATGGTGPTGGSATGGSATGGGGNATACGGKTANTNPNPFGCEFAWGANGNTNDRASYLNFITAWIGYEPFPPNNRPNDCDGCGLIRELAQSDAIPVFYAYYIAYAATAEGYGDCNTDSNLDLCTNGAQWIRDHRQEIVDFYAGYAAKTHAANPNKPVVWLLDGDFMQYQEPSQQPSPLSVAELGRLVDDMTCAIKTNAPNAVIAINHTPWNADEETDAFFDAVNLDLVDMVWTTGVGNNQGLINQGAGTNVYNATTARYSYLYEYTGKPVFVDTSFGVSQQADSWSNNPAEVLNQRIAEGVIAANVTEPPTDYQARVTNLAPSLDSTCR